LRNPIIAAAVLYGWESVNGILPHALQKMSILYYLQSLCPVPAPMDDDAPTLIWRRLPRRRRVRKRSSACCC
jgi:hypothetical protein